MKRRKRLIKIINDVTYTQLALTNNKHETSAVNVRVSYTYVKYELSALDAAVKPGKTHNCH